MKTERLYYQDAYLRTFTARVVAARAMNGRPPWPWTGRPFTQLAAGSRTILGTLAGLPVSDVNADGDLVWHVLA